MTKKQAILFLILIIVAGSVLRFYKFYYGVGGPYVADTQTVSEAMDIGSALSGAGFGIFLKPVKYPFVLPYLILFLHGIYFFAGKVFGVFKTPSDFLRFIALNQNFSFLVARLISVISGVLIIIFTFLSSKILADRFRSPRPYWAAIISAFFASFSLLLFQFSRLERPHIIAGFFILLSYFFYLKFLEKPTHKTGLLVGTGVGLAAGTLQSGILAGIFLLVPPVIYLVTKDINYKKIISGFFSATVLLVFGYPFLFLSFKKAAGLSSGKFDVSFSGAAHNVFPFGGQGFYKVIHHIFWYEPALFALFLLGLILLIYGKRIKEFLKADNGALILFFLIFFIAFGVYNFTLPRYVIPMVLVMALLSGIFTIEVSRSLAENYWLKSTGIIFIVILALFSLAQVSRMTFLLRFPDTRDVANDWLKQNTTKADVILEAENVISLPPDKRSILKNKELGVPLGRKDELLLSVADAEYHPNSRNVLRGWGLKITDYRRFFTTNKVKYVVFSDEEGFRNINDSLFIFADKNLKLDRSFSPFVKNEGLSSPFPGDFHNPVRELWGIKQMGPEVRVYSVY